MAKHMSTNDLLQDLLLLENMRIDQGQQQMIERLRRHVRALWRHVQRIESVLTSSQNELMLQVGDASLLMKKDGTILIEGRNITIKASGRIDIDGQRINVKSTGPLTLRGQKILEN